MSKAPDTRNRIDTQSNINHKPRFVPKKKTATDFKKTMRQRQEEQAISMLTGEPKKSKGQLFKEKYGYSKSMKRNMQRKALVPGENALEVYRAIRRKAKAAVRVIQKAKRAKALAGRKQKGAKNAPKQPVKKAA